MAKKKTENATVEEAKPVVEEVKPVVEEAKPAQPVEPAPQPQVVAPKAKVLYDENGNPVFIQQQPTTTARVPKEKPKKTGPFVASIVTLVLSVILTFLAIWFFYAFLGAADDGAGIFMFILYLVSGIGVATLIPGLGCAIAALTCSIIACKSRIKAFRVISGFTIFFSIVCLIGVLVVPFVIALTTSA